MQILHLIINILGITGLGIMGLFIALNILILTNLLIQKAQRIIQKIQREKFTNISKKPKNRILTIVL